MGRTAMRDRQPILAVIGAGACDPVVAAAAFEVGAEVARRGAILLTGGRGGVMKAASQGAASQGGLVVGILPGGAADEANAFVAVPIVTGMGEARNVILARTADALNALSGEYGTLSEIALALKFRKPVITLDGDWATVSRQIQHAASPADAVERALRAIAHRLE